MASADRLIEVFNEAKARSAGAERERFVAEACRNEPALKAQVLALLQAHDGAGDFLKHTQLASPASLLTERPGDRIGCYKLLQQIGEGGCGVVYMAEQEEPVRRRVALKVIKLGMDTKQVIARFEAERQALALMDHPNIAKVLEAGATDAGRPYFVMELVRGVKITEYCDEVNLATRERLGLFIEVCQAIQHAHQKGIIHRDIKPSNILVTINDGVAVPKVIDFGIAKATNQQPLTDKTVFTAFEQFIGTPAYMSPEQAVLTSLDIDTRSDIYSLGVLLYELLTGNTPFDAKELCAAGLEEMRRTIREKEPARPSTRLRAMLAEELTTTAKHRHTDAPKLIHLLHGDLDWIVMKALEKDRVRRYETANGLARDIQRHLTNEPVLARPPSRLYEFQKTVRRHKFGFAAAAALVLVLAAGVVVSTSEAIRAARAEREQSRLRQRAEQAGDTAKRQEQLARESANEARRQQRLASDQEFLARRRFYSAQMNLASQAVEAGQPARALDLLETQRPQPGQEDLRGFDWYYLWRRANMRHRGAFRGGTSPVSCVTFSPDDKTVASASLNGTIRLWDVRNGHERVILEGTSATAVAFTPDGQTLISVGGDHLVRLWDLASRKVRATLSGHTGWVRSVAVAPDGKIFATGEETSTIKLWDTATGHERGSIVHPHGPVIAAVFSPDGKTLATASGWGTNGGPGDVMLWDLGSGWPRPKLQLAEAHSVSFSPDEATLVTANDGVRAYDTATGRLLASQEGNSDGTGCVAFLPDGKTVASGSGDRTVRLWKLPFAAEPAARYKIIGAHLEPVACLAVSGDGKLLASGANDGSIELWDLSRTQEQLDAQVAASCQAGDWLESLCFSPDGRTLFASTEGGTRLIDTAFGLAYAEMPTATSFAAISPDGKVLATATGTRRATLRLWDHVNCRLLRSVEAHKDGARGVAFSPDGRTLASGAFGDSALKLWDTATLKPLRTITTRNGSVTCVAYSPDGGTLAAGNENNKVFLFDPLTGGERLMLDMGSGFLWVQAIAFSRDGKLLAAGGDSGVVKLWDVQTGKLRTTLKGHTGTIRALAFSPDGSIVVSGGADRTVRLWDMASSQERITLKGFTTAVHAVAFSPDGNLLAAGSHSGQIMLWRGTRSLEGFAPDGFAQDKERLRFVRSNAEALLLSGYERMKQAGVHVVSEAVRLIEGTKRLVGSYELTGELDKADEWRKRDALAQVALQAATEVATRRKLGNELADQGKWSQAEIAYREELALRRKQAGNDDPETETLYALRNLAGALEGQGKWAEAEAVHREALVSWRKREGNGGSETSYTLHKLGEALAAQAKWSEAENIYREELALRRKQAGNDDPETLYALRNLGTTLEYAGKWAEAENVHREALASWRKRAGNDDPQTLYTLDRLGWTLEGQGKWSEAENVCREGLASLRNGAGNEAPQTLSEIESLTRVLMRQKKFAETEQSLEEALTPAVVRQPSSCNLLIRRVELMGRQGRWPEAVATATLVVEYQPTDQFRYHTLAALLAITQNRPAYETFCGKILATFTNTTDPYVDERIAKDCLLLPDSGVDLAFMDELADKAVSLGSGYPDAMPYFQAAKAMSAYRLGHFAESIEWAEKTVKSSIIYPNAHAYAILAMAQWELGHKDVARAMLEKGDSLTPNILPAHQAVDLGDSWVAWLQARISLDEATILIQPASKTEGNSQKP